MTNAQNITPGMEMLHYRPATGRIIRIVRVVEVNGEAITVEPTSGKNKGTTYLVGPDVLTPV